MRNKQKIKRFIKTLPQQFVMIIVAIAIIFPLYYVFVNSFKTSMEYISNMIGLPQGYTLENYVNVFKSKNVASWFVNSIILSFVASIVTTAVGMFAAFAFAKLRFKGKDFLFKLIIPLTAIPPVAMLIPQFKMVNAFGMLNSLTSVAFIYAGLMIPMTIYLFRNFMVSIPDSLLEASIIDGCSTFGALIRIILPLSVPSIITAGLVNLVWAWNEMLIALVFLQKESLRTIIVGITMLKGRFTLNVPSLMAGLAIASIPMILLYIFAQKYIVAGLLEGSVKE